jgi:hypothetical protein
MKKWMLAMIVIVAAAIPAASAFAHPNHGSSHSPSNVSVSVNGVEVPSKKTAAADGKVLVSVQAFAALFGETAQVDEKRKTVEWRGRTMKLAMAVQGEAYAWIRDLAAAAEATQVTWDKEKNEVYVLVLPKGTIQLEPVVIPAMGEHWANPADLPTGPIYGVYKGKLVFIEYMISQQDFNDGKSFNNLQGMKGVPSPAIVQSDLGFMPEGHPGFEVPHYDLHYYFISDEEQQQIK